MDPADEAQLHIELAERFLQEGVALADRDPVQASEKLYEAAEECIKAAAAALGLQEVLAKVRARGRWTVAELEKAARAAAEKIGEEIYIGWDAANFLHVWGFHEAKLDREAVAARVPYIRRMVESVKALFPRRDV